MKKLFVYLIVAIVVYSAMCEMSYGLSEYGYRDAKIVWLKGKVQVKKADSKKWIDAQKGMILKEEDMLKTSSKSAVKVIFDEQGSFEGNEFDGFNMESSTTITLSKLTYDVKTNERITILDLPNGTIIAHSTKLEGESRFEVITPTQIVGVRGTNFKVTVGLQ